jgi:UDP-N-acetylmuramyl pentapeptide phosphotransferase/UDP-N-acetylglucosamine-1-phosphate transferase
MPQLQGMGFDQASVELRSGVTVTGWLSLHLLIGVVGTWLARRYALKRNLIDQPGERRSHQSPTPRGGGIAIVVSMLIAGSWWLPQAGQVAPMLVAFLVGLTLIAVVGLVDDHRPLSPWLRMAVHVVAACLLAVAAWMTWGHVAIAVAAFVLALVLTNVWNFMDGIDGLAASQTVLVAAAVAIAAGDPWRSLALALLAACLGFLPFNFPKARIFLGDVGSGTLGFALATLVVAAIAVEPRSFTLWLLPLSAFLIDASLTLLGRLRREEAWWQPHALHAYQQWVRRGGSHSRVTMAYGAWTGAAILLMFWLWGKTPYVMMISCMAWYMTGAGGWRLLQRKGIDEVAENME